MGSLVHGFRNIKKQDLKLRIRVCVWTHCEFVMHDQDEQWYQQWWLAFVIHNYWVCRLMGKSISRKYTLMEVCKHARWNL